MRLFVLALIILLPITASADWKSDAEKAIEEFRTSDAIDILQPIADRGDAEAAWLLGLALEKEILVWDELEQINGRHAIIYQLHYWEVAALKKHPQAALNLGLVYMGRYPHHLDGAAKRLRHRKNLFETRIAEWQTGDRATCWLG